MPIVDQISEALQYTFIQRALVAGCFIALSCAFLGIFLVLRRFSLIGDGLAHVSFATIALGLFLHTQPMIISIPLVAVASLWILRLTERSQIYGDAAIGLISALGIASGVMFASLAGGFNIDLFSYLFGNILVVSSIEVWLSVGLSTLVLVLVALFYHDLFSITFDEEYARVSGVRVGMINKILIMLTAVTVVLGIKIVGTMLVSSLIILPAVTALNLVRGFKAGILAASILAVSSIILGIFISYVFDLPSGATIVLINFVFFLVSFPIRNIK